MRLWTLDIHDGGKVSVVSRPLGDGLLMSEMEELVEAGVDALVSLLEPSELPILGLEDEALAASVSGIRFLHEPVRDKQPPGRTDRVLKLLREAASEVRSGAHVAAHCHAGHGRSPSFIVGVLISLGLDPDSAMQQLSAVRGKDVPHRLAQVEWARWVSEQQSV